MTSRVTVSGKHALTVRVSVKDYESLSMIALREKMTVNELLAAKGAEMAEIYRSGVKAKE